MARVLSANKSTSIAQNPQIAQAAAFINLRGTFVQKKKPKQSNTAVVEIIQSLYFCRCSDQTDGCFVTCGGDLWLCSLEKCKVARSVHVNSGLVDSFECQHIKEEKNSSDCCPIVPLYPDLVNYPCSDVFAGNFRGFWFSFSQ